MQFTVRAIAIDPSTGATYPPRDETIDTEANALFSGCFSEWDVEDAYEAFWNRLDGSWEAEFPRGKEKVKVVSVARL